MAQPYSPETRSPWWTSKEMNRAVCGNIDAINKNQAYREQDNLAAMRYYGGLEYMGLGVGGYGRVGTPTGKIALNVIRSCVDAAQAKIAKNKVKPTPLTNDGDYALQRKAKRLDLFGQGAFYSTQFHRKAPLIFRDAEIFGTGIGKVYGNARTQELFFDRVFVNEIKVDDADAINGEPRSIYQERPMSREVACGFWPDFKKQIDECDPISNAFVDTHVPTSDMIMIREAWHLPSFKGAKDGRHWLGIKTATFDDCEWTRKRFPFATLKWNEPLLGWFGTGLTHELADIQYEINFLLQRVQEAFKILGVPMVFIEAGSEVNPEQFSNVVGNVYVYTGTPPTVQAFQSVNPEIFSHLDRLYQRAYEIVGISMLSAQSRKPAGLDSGAALSEFNDIESERFMPRGQAYEQFAVDSFDRMIDEVRDMTASPDNPTKGSYKVKVTGRRFGRRFMDTIDWKNVDLDEDAYVLQVFPSSSLPTTPAGRRAELERRVKMGITTPEEAIEQMDLPDTERANSLALAALHDIDATIDHMLYGGEDDADTEDVYSPPEPYQNLQLGLKRCQIEYLRARRSGVPDERLELLRRWMTDAQALLNGPQQNAAGSQAADPNAMPPPPGMPPPGAAPMGPPMPQGMAPPGVM